MAVTGKTGADAIFISLRHICRVISKYRAKLDNVIDAAVTNNIITSAQGTTAHTFVATAQAACDIFALIAGYSGF